MTLEEFIQKNDVESSKMLIDEEDLIMMSKYIGVKFGTKIKDYVTKYGYLAYKNIEFYGINNRQMEKSDMISQSVYIHKYFPKTKNYIAFEHNGEDSYAIVDSEDKVYIYNADTDQIEYTGKDLNGYCVFRFEKAS